MNNIGEKIKELRRKNNMTQEQLAEYLWVTYQTVSKWETGVTSPDISLLPAICNFFNITSDELLCIDIKKKTEKINSLLVEAQNYSVRGYYEEAREILEAGLHEYPESCSIMNDLMYIAYWQSLRYKEKAAYRSEAIQLGEAILEKSTDDRLRQGAIKTLCLAYRDEGKIDEAVKLANNMPFISSSNEMLLSSILTGDTGYHAKQTEASILLHFISHRLVSMQEKLDSGIYAYNEEELAILRDKQIALLHLFFENGDFGFYHYLLYETHVEQAKYYIKAGSNEKALSHLGSASEHAIGFITSKTDDKYTSIVFRGMDRGSWCGGDTDNHAALLLKELDDNMYDRLRTTPEFAEIKTKLCTYADRWHVK